MATIRLIFLYCVLACLQKGAFPKVYHENQYDSASGVGTLQDDPDNATAARPVIGWSDSDVEVFDHAPSAALNGQIVGGQYADIKMFPYLLQVAKKNTQNCGAAIISDSWAVTAAHCMVDHNGKTVPKDVITLRAGATFRDTGGRVHRVSKVILHPNYDEEDGDYDIALLKVKTPFQFGSRVQKIALPRQGQKVNAGEKAVVSGWGLRKESGSELSESLQYVIVPIVSHKKCERVYRSSLSSRMICAGLPRGGKDSCQGDSGGPLTINKKLVGIVSWGEGCASPKSPGVYSKVSKFRNWIEEHTGV